MKLDTTVSVKVIVGWAIAILTAVATAAVWYQTVNMTIADLESRVSELEGGMDFKNGVIYLGQNEAYYKGMHAAMGAVEPKKEEEENP